MSQNTPTAFFLYSAQGLCLGLYYAYNPSDRVILNYHALTGRVIEPAYATDLAASDAAMMRHAPGEGR